MAAIVAPNKRVDLGNQLLVVSLDVDVDARVGESLKNILELSDANVVAVFVVRAELLLVDKVQRDGMPKRWQVLKVSLLDFQVVTGSPKQVLVMGDDDHVVLCQMHIELDHLGPEGNGFSERF